MPCPWARRSAPTNPSDDNDTSPTPCPVPADVKARFAHRRNMFMYLRKQTRTIVLLMALMEALRVGPAQIVFAGKDGYPARGEDDFGIAYWVGYFISWIYMCVFMVVWMPLFSWWVPNIPSTGTSGEAIESFMNVLKKFDLFILPVGISLCLVSHFFNVMHSLIHVDSPGSMLRRPDGSRKAWAARLLLIAGMLWSVTFGYYIFVVLEMTGLAKVKNLEYGVIVVPVQINFGLVLGSIMQWKMERRIARKEEALKATDEEAVPMLSEKSELIET